MFSMNTTIGQQTLTVHGLNFNEFFVWISVGALFVISLLFNFGFTLGLTFLDSSHSRAIISSEQLSLEGCSHFYNGNNVEGRSKQLSPKQTNDTIKDRTILPFEPLTVSFQNLQYYIDNDQEFVKEVLKIIDLDEIKDSLVGRTDFSNMSTEQRKRLTIAVELVANSSIIFMDEPTTGLDTRAAAIVMHVVKNVADTGRTIVCIIHQPSIDIFESFDEAVNSAESWWANNLLRTTGSAFS